jgi:hypothetical protein
VKSINNNQGQKEKLMNARNVCTTLLVISGLVLTPGLVQSAAADTGLRSALDTIQQEQITDFHRRSLDEFPQQDIAVRSESFAETGLADSFIREAEIYMRLHGRLASWRIQEEQLIGYSTGMLARRLARQELGVAAATASANDGPRFGKAGELLKSARFEWPDFMPPILLR